MSKTKVSEEKEIAKIKEYEGIKRLMSKGKYELALIALEEYLKKYPGNSFALKEYSTILRHYNKPLEALELLLDCKKEKIHIIRERAICYMNLGEYKSSLKELEKLNSLNEVERKLKYFCYAKLGYPPKSMRGFYGIEQIIEYSRERAIEHIKSNNKPDANVHFVKDIEELYDNITELLPQAKSVINSDIMLHYIFKVDNVGYREGERVDYVTAVTLPNSYDILTLYLTKSENVETSLVNNYDSFLQQQEITSVKTKIRESQVDKFNRRYGKK